MAWLAPVAVERELDRHHQLEALARHLGRRRRQRLGALDQRCDFFVQRGKPGASIQPER
jgi:hypothetical protein